MLLFSPRLLRGSLCLAVLLASFTALTWGDDSLSVGRMKMDLYYLASEDCEGRGAETEGINRAADYIATQFKRMGLNRKNDGNYFQPFVLKGVSKLGAPNNFTLKGPGGKTIEAEFGKQFGIPGISVKGKASASLVYVGYGLTLPERKVDPKDAKDKKDAPPPFKYDDYAGVDVKGKIVVITRKAPRDGNKEKPFSSEADSLQSLASKVQNAEAHKVAGVIFLNDVNSAGKTDSLMTFDYARGDGGELPVVHMKRDLFDQILEGEKKSLKEIEAKIDEESKPNSFEIKEWKAEIETTIQQTELKVKNVVGVLEGKGPLANETVIIGAHYDHLGRGERGSLSKGSKDIHFGADDNGSGTTGMLELARRFAAKKNYEGRRIVFMGFAGEERGLRGSQHYVKEPLFPLDSTVTMINLDMIGRVQVDPDLKKDRVEVGGVGTAKGFREQLDRINKKYDFNIKRTETGVGPSDHASFYPKNIPVYFYFSGMHPEYHRPTDTPDLINYNGMKKIVDMVEELATEISTGKERPTYVAGMNKGMQIDRGSGGAALPRIAFMPGEYDDDETRGVPVGGVTKDGPADKAGMKAGDWIVEVGGKPVKNMTGYMSAMTAARKGTAIEMVVTRDGKKVTLKVIPE